MLLTLVTNKPTAFVSMLGFYTADSHSVYLELALTQDERIPDFFSHEAVTAILDRCFVAL